MLYQNRWLSAVFSVLVLTSVGVYVVLGTLDTMSLGGDCVFDRLLMEPLLWAVSLTMCVALLVVAGNLWGPRVGFRALWAGRSSWIAREIAAAVAFTALSLALAIIYSRDVDSLVAYLVLAGLATSAGLCSIFAMARAHVVRARIPLRLSVALAHCTFTAVLLGAIATAAGLLMLGEQGVGLGPLNRVLAVTVGFACAGGLAIRLTSLVQIRRQSRRHALRIRPVGAQKAVRFRRAVTWQSLLCILVLTAVAACTCYAVLAPDPVWEGRVLAGAALVAALATEIPTSQGLYDDRILIGVPARRKHKKPVLTDTMW